MDMSIAQDKISASTPRTRKRKRTVISCTECHRRKQKCNRNWPCQNCIKRGKTTLCQYEVLESRECSNNRDEIDVSSGVIDADLPLGMETEERTYQDHNVLINDFGYSAHTQHSTLSVLGALDWRSNDSTASSVNKDMPLGTIQDELPSRYRDLVRQLPAKLYTEPLLQLFFRNVNWGYDVVDEVAFQQQMEAWRNIPYSVLQQGPNALDLELRVFPALLLQVLAQTLLYYSSDDETLSSLKHMPGMSFQDVARELSDAGAAILELLGKRSITLGTVQAGLLRAAFLKSNGLVVEAWHTLGGAIRDAQELGLHSNQGVSDQLLSHSDAMVGAAWSHERRSRLWLILHIWDTHMAVVLGRPITTRLLKETFVIPRDVCTRQEGIPPIERTESDPPTAFSVILAGYMTAYQYFPTVHEIERSGGRSGGYATVDKIHTAIVDNIQSLPAWCRADVPDFRFDHEASCTWLPAAREMLWSLVHFVLLALHRSYIFSAAKSRTRALRAALEILHAQSRLFKLFEPQQPKVFNMVYASLDAIVLVAAIYILYPNENRDDLSDSLQSIEWGLARLSTLGECNHMARTAHGVVLSLYRRLKMRLSRECSDTNALEIFAVSPGEQGTSEVDSSHRSDGYMGGHINNNFGTSPPHVMQDLFFENLSGVSLPITDEPFTSLLDNLPVDSQNSAFDFCGTYSSDSFWSFMNNFPPSFAG